MRAFLAMHWFLISLIFGVGAALLWPSALRQVTIYWNPNLTVAASLLLVAWTMPTQALVAELRQPLASLWAVALSYGLVPLAAWTIGHVTSDADVRTGLILVS